MVRHKSDPHPEPEEKPIVPVLTVLLLLQVKHVLADYFLQVGFMMRGRARYLHAGRAAHAALHGAGTAAAFALTGAGPWVALALGLADLAIHFHVDWLKARHVERRGLSPDRAGYWRAAGLDQFAHQATYLGLVALWAAA